MTASTSRLDAGSIRGERGAALIVAILFLTVGSLLVVSLTNLSGTNLLNTSALQQQRNVEYAADGAMDGAIQTVRYHAESASDAAAGTCQSFPKSGRLALGGGLFAFVSCTGTYMSSVAFKAGNPSELTPPANAIFVPEDVGLQVFDTNIPGFFTTVTGYNNSDGTLTIATAATSSAVNAQLGNAFQRLDLFSACVSTSSTINSCNPKHAVITAVVSFQDTDNSSNSVNGFNMSIQRWDVNTANG